MVTVDKFDGQGQKAVLSKVLYAPHLATKSAYADTLRVPIREFKSTCCFSLDMTSEEAHDFGIQEGIVESSWTRRHHSTVKRLTRHKTTMEGCYAGYSWPPRDAEMLFPVWVGCCHC